MRAPILMNGGALMMTDSIRNTGRVENREIRPCFGHLQMMVADGRAWLDRALAAGSMEIAPCERQP